MVWYTFSFSEFNSKKEYQCQRWHKSVFKELILTFWIECQGHIFTLCKFVNLTLMTDNIMMFMLTSAHGLFMHSVVRFRTRTTTESRPMQCLSEFLSVVPTSGVSQRSAVSGRILSWPLGSETLRRTDASPSPSMTMSSQFLCLLTPDDWSFLLLMFL